MKRRASGLAMIALAASLACGRSKHGGPVEPGASLPPEVDQVYPAARASRVWDDTEIWVRFKQPLDSTTVTPSNLFLKIDTRRIACTIRYESVTRRILISPTLPLEPPETYTVELRPDLATADGGTLGQVWFWQFTLLGLRRLTSPQPAEGAVGEPPLAPLKWQGTEPSIGDIVYDLYAGADSAQVEARTMPALTRTTAPYWIPDTRWPLGETRFWSINAINRTTGDTLAGPVWRFGVVDANAPIDSVRVIANDWGYYIKSNRQSLCFESSIYSGSLYNCGFAWTPRALGLGRKLALAYFRMTAIFPPDPAPAVWSIAAPFKGSPCRLGDPDPPLRLLPLTAGVLIAPQTIHFESDALTAQVQAMVSELPAYGFSLTSPTSVRYGAPPTIVLYYYR